MIQKHPLLKSTAILTCAGMVSRIIGFFYRIFLSKTIGAEGIGIYLLLFPIQTLLFSLTSSGIQTAISRFVSARLASNDKRSQRHPSLRYDALCPVFRDCFFFLYQNANFVAVSLLHEARCSSLLKILSFALPFAGVHACIIGYYTGLKKPPSLPSPSWSNRPPALPLRSCSGRSWWKKKSGNPCTCHVCYADLGDHRGSVYRNPVSAPPSVFF